MSTQVGEITALPVSAWEDRLHPVITLIPFDLRTLVLALPLLSFRTVNIITWPIMQTSLDEGLISAIVQIFHYNQITLLKPE